MDSIVEHDRKQKEIIAKEIDYLRARLRVAEKYGDEVEVSHLLTIRHVLAQGLRKMAEMEQAKK